MIRYKGVEFNDVDIDRVRAIATDEAKRTGKPQRLTCGRGLLCMVNDKGFAWWVVKAPYQGKATFQIGSLCSVTITDAHQASLAMQKLAKSGSDPRDYLAPKTP